MPVSLSIELTNFCNLHCPECPSGSGALTRKRGFMEQELFKKIVEESGSCLFNINLYFQGESMLHPQLFDFLEKIRGFNSVISTNGHFLTHENSENLVRSGLKKLIISLDGMDQETYSSYRKNGSLSIVKEGIKKVAEAKKRFRSKIRLEIQLLVNQINEQQIPEVRKFAAGVNASLKLKSMQVINSENIGNWIPSIAEYRRYRKINGEWKIKSSMPDRCRRLWFNPVITWDGKVVPCCFDKNACHVMGDLNAESFRKIWHGQKYNLFRKRLLSNRKDIEICTNCTSGLKNVRY
jgi:radical SAM protein with 4Fe4S-binding SPASM domain